MIHLIVTKITTVFVFVAQNHNTYDSLKINMCDILISFIQVHLFWKIIPNDESEYMLYIVANISLVDVHSFTFYFMYFNFYNNYHSYLIYSLWGPLIICTGFPDFITFNRLLCLFLLKDTLWLCSHKTRVTRMWC